MSETYGGSGVNPENTLANFDAFADDVYERLIRHHGAAAGARLYLHAEAAGMLNDFYDQPEKWTSGHSMALCTRIAREEIETRALLQEMRSLELE